MTDAEFFIGCSSLIQARAGGDLLHVTLAERAYVTNPSLTLRKRAGAEGPWNKEEMRNYFRYGTPRSMTITHGSNNTTGSVIVGPKRDIFAVDLFAEKRNGQSPGWKLAVEAAISRKNELKAKQRLDDQMRSEFLAKRSMDSELSRAKAIFEKSAPLNERLLQLASSVDEMLPEDIRRKAKQTSNNNSPRSTTGSDNGSKREKLESIVRALD